MHATRAPRLATRRSRNPLPLLTLLIATALAAVFSAAVTAYPKPRSGLVTSACTDSCAVLHQQALDEATDRLGTCLGNAGGDPELEGACRYAFDNASYAADLQFQKCVSACAPVPTRRTSWGKLKTFYR
jgi:hypothetical protein